MISHAGSTSHTHTSSGCGCGGGSGCGCGGACECQGGLQDICHPCSETGLSRPRFFAGQLLTEEDLQSVIDYVLERHRLTNRHLFGDGVVCGLQIHIDPCNQKRIIVDPGHALDCCGNDIVVPCPVTLDILKMVHDFRVKARGGFDCGDPCAEEDTTTEEDDVAADDADSIGDARREPLKKLYDRPETPEKDHRLHLDLFIRYCEQRTEPVAPYDVGAECDPSSCEWTRIHEGFRFELRCHEEAPDRETMRDRQKACMPERREIDHKTAGEISKAQVFLEMVRHVSDDAQTLRREGVKAAEVNDLKAAWNGLEPMAEGEDVIPAEDLPTAFDFVRRIAGGARRLDIAPNPELTSEAELPPTNELRKRARSVLGRIKATTGPEKAFVDERLIASAEEALHDRPAEDVERPDVNFADRAHAAGVPYNVRDAQQMLEGLRSLKRRVIETLDRRRFITSGTLERELASVRLDIFASAELDSQREVEMLAAAAKRLSDIARRAIEECVCAAVLPPCPPCDDRSVRIACLQVSIDKCAVLDVCNLCRIYVPSVPALRYWGIDPVSKLVDDWGRRCCPPPCPRERPQREVEKPADRRLEDDKPSAPDPIGYAATMFPMRLSDPPPQLIWGSARGVDAQILNSREPVVVETQMPDGAWERRRVAPEVLRLLATAPAESRSPLTEILLSRSEVAAEEREETPVRWRFTSRAAPAVAPAGERTSTPAPARPNRRRTGGG